MSRISKPRERPSGLASYLVFLLNLLATTHFVWFYLSKVECHVRLLAYEQGTERVPFQYRLLLMDPLRWAHHAPALQSLAVWLTSQRGFFPNGVRPEGLLQAVIDLVSVGLAGMVARRLYQLSSPTGLLAPFVYPLTLLMLLTTYSFLTMHSYRFIYDLPAVAFLSLGMYCIYARKHPLWLASVFLIGTVNRETTVLLLAFLILAECNRGLVFDWKQSYALATLSQVLPLAVFWLGWHAWVVHRFRANPVAIHPPLWLNLGIVAVPLTWPQILGVFSYLLPLILLYRRHLQDTVLRAWLWMLPVWLLLMLYYGVILEIRVFGELIPYMACISALIAEDKLLHFLERSRPPGARLSTL